MKAFGCVSVVVGEECGGSCASTKNSSNIKHANALVSAANKKMGASKPVVRQPTNRSLHVRKVGPSQCGIEAGKFLIQHTS
jgi:hypothetical protein